MQAQHFIPPVSVLETINATHALLPDTSAVKSMELATKALPPAIMAAYQNVPSFHTPVLSAALNSSQMIERLTRFQNPGAGTYEAVGDSEENESTEESTDDKPENDMNEE